MNREGLCLSTASDMADGLCVGNEERPDSGRTARGKGEGEKRREAKKRRVPR